MEEIVKPWRILVTGTGRCGTGYLAKVLTSVGIKTSHEGIFRPNQNIEENIKIRLTNPQWDWEGESSWLAAPWLEHWKLKELTIIHLVRHPKKVIDSQMRIRAFDKPGNMFFEYQMKYLPQMRILSPIDRAAYFYIIWNAWIENSRWDRIFHRVEDDVRILLDKCQIDYRDKQIYDRLNFNSRIGWDESDVDLHKDISEPYRS